MINYASLAAHKQKNNNSKSNLYVAYFLQKRNLKVLRLFKLSSYHAFVIFDYFQIYNVVLYQKNFFIWDDWLLQHINWQPNQRYIHKNLAPFKLKHNFLLVKFLLDWVPHYKFVGVLVNYFVLLLILPLLTLLCCFSYCRPQIIFIPLIGFLHFHIWRSLITICFWFFQVRWRHIIYTIIYND